MSLISFTPIQDGVTGVNAAATNNPLNTIYNDYNGNITDANIASSAAIAPSKLAGGNTNMLSTWQSWIPIWTGITIGTSTVVGNYVQIGKFVAFTLQVNIQSGFTLPSSGESTFSLPVTAASRYSGVVFIGAGELNHTDGSHPYTILSSSTTTAKLQTLGLSGSIVIYFSVNTSNAAVAVNDTFEIQGYYEAA